MDNIVKTNADKDTVLLAQIELFFQELSSAIYPEGMDTGIAMAEAHGFDLDESDIKSFIRGWQKSFCPRYKRDKDSFFETTRGLNKYINHRYIYHGKEIVEGKFDGFLDVNHEIPIINNKVYRKGKEIPTKAPASRENCYWTGNLLIQCVDGKGFFYDENGKILKEFEAEKFKGIDEEKQQAAFEDKHNAISVYDFSNPSEISEVVPSERIQIFKSNSHYIDKNSLARDVVPQNIKVYDQDNNEYILSDLIRTYKDEDSEYEFHNLQLSTPIIEKDCEELYSFDNFKRNVSCVFNTDGGYVIDYCFDGMEEPEKVLEHIADCDKEDLVSGYSVAIIEQSRKGNEKYPQYAETIKQYYSEQYGEDINKAAAQLFLENKYNDLIEDAMLPEEIHIRMKHILDLELKSHKSQEMIDEMETVFKQYPKQAKKIGYTTLIQYLILHPEQKELAQYIDSKYLQPKDISALYDVGINILQPYEFPRATSPEQKKETCLKDFYIRKGFEQRVEDFVKAFRGLDNILEYDKNPVHRDIAEILLLKLVKENKKIFEQKKNNLGHCNATAFLCAHGIDTHGICDVNDWTAIDWIGINSKYIKELSGQGKVKFSASLLFRRSVDEVTPLDETFQSHDPSDRGCKTNMLDYKLREREIDEAIKLLNMGADVFVNVERYSMKQDRTFPIRPFTRFVDNMIYKNKVEQLNKTMIAIAEGLDSDKEKVIDDIFTSLPYKTKQNELLKNLQKQMHQAFRKKHNSNSMQSEEVKFQKIISNKISELKGKSQTGNIADVPHAKTQILRDKDNLGKPKRADANKKVIQAALNKAIESAGK